MKQQELVRDVTSRIDTFCGPTSVAVEEVCGDLETWRVGS
jgi:hypothetical protein